MFYETEFQCYKQADVYSFGLVIWELCRRTNKDVSSPKFENTTILVLNFGSFRAFVTILLNHTKNIMFVRPHQMQKWQKLSGKRYEPIFFFLNSISTYFQFVISETTTNNTQKMGRSPLKPPNQRNVVPRTQSSTQHAQLEKASEKSATSIIITTPSFWPRNWKKQI